MTSPTLLAGERDTVRRAAALDHDAIVQTLARAFLDDPVFRWYFPQARGRLERNERFFRGMVLDACAPHGTVWTTHGAAGAALWQPPGTPAPSAREQLRLLPELARLCGRHLVRALRGTSEQDKHHPHDVDHWYLFFVGVEPAAQGGGIGSALMRPVLDRCDADGAPAYLDATTPRSRALYEREGFVVTGEYRLPGGGPPMWSMWREPR